jgi:hypothetical protein
MALELWMKKQINMEKVKVLIDEEKLRGLGTASLIGTISVMTNGAPLTELKEVVLVFPQTTMGWKSKNKEPEEFIIYEHNVPCLLQDVVSLLSRGTKVSVEMPEISK